MEVDLANTLEDMANNASKYLKDAKQKEPRSNFGILSRDNKATFKPLKVIKELKQISTRFCVLKTNISTIERATEEVNNSCKYVQRAHYNFATQCRLPIKVIDFKQTHDDPVIEITIQYPMFLEKAIFTMKANNCDVTSMITKQLHLSPVLVRNVPSKGLFLAPKPVNKIQRPDNGNNSRGRGQNNNNRGNRGNYRGGNNTRGGYNNHYHNQSPQRGGRGRYRGAKP
jgi:hypothetical protein